MPRSRRSTASHVARRRARLLHRTAGRRSVAGAACGPARRRGAVDGLHGDGDDGERVYPSSSLRARARAATRAPDALRYVAFFAALGLAYLTRSQAIVIAAAAVTAPVLLGVFRAGAFRTTVWPFRWLYAIFVGGHSARRSRAALRGMPLSSLLGSYCRRRRTRCTTTSRGVRFVVYHLAELDLYLGSRPARRRDRAHGPRANAGPPLQVLLAVTIALVAWTVVVVGTFASRFADRIQERNTFALAPLFLILLLAWVERGAVRPRVIAPLAAAARRYSCSRSRSIGSSARRRSPTR